MKIGIIGAGAIGGFFAARLASAGHSVSVLARGATLEALRKHGQRLETQGQSLHAKVQASDQAGELGPQELLILAVKAYSLEQVLPAVAAMSTARTVLVPALNGLPWWYFLAASGPLAGRRLSAVDPLGSIAQAIPLAAVLGCVVFPACSSIAPGHVQHASGNRIVLGEPAGGPSVRATATAELMRLAGFEAEASNDLRRDIWLKLLGNACFNPVSLLTRSSTDRLIDDLLVNEVFVTMMQETLALGRAIGIEVEIDPSSRLAMTRRLGAVKTSMLQDAQTGRPVELDAILGVLVEIADTLALPAPTLSTVYALARMHARVAGLDTKGGN